MSPPSLQGETGKSTLIFLDCFAISDSFNTARYFCLVSKKIPRVNIEVLKDLRLFLNAWAFLAFVPTSLNFLQAKIYKLWPLPDIVQQGDCWKNKKDRKVWNARSEIIPTCTSCYQIQHLKDLSILSCNKHVDSQLLELTVWHSEKGVLGKAWLLYGEGSLNCKVSLGILSMCLHRHTVGL